MSDPVPRTPSRGRWIVSTVALLAVVGVFGLVFSAYRPLGILILVAAVMAMILTALATIQAKRAGQPTDLGKGVGTFAQILGATLLVLIASSIAFVATCFPIGLFGTNGEGGDPNDDKVIRIAYVVGGVAAVAAGAATAYFLDRNRRIGLSEKPMKKRRW